MAHSLNLLVQKYKVTLERMYTKQMFQPSLLGILVNPSYIVRRALYRGILSNKDYVNGICLDFGCGKKPYRNLFHVEQYIGLDIENDAHSHKDENIDIYYDGKKIPFRDAYFDSIFSSEVFEHVFNIDEVLDELFRVLKPGGFMLFTVPFVWDEHETPNDFSRYTSYGIKKLVHKHGFDVLVATKSTNYIETISQMWVTYIRRVILPTKPLYKFLLTPLFIAPFTCLGILLAKLLPENRNFYHDNVVVAQKPSTKRTT